MYKLASWGPATVLIVLLAVIIVGVGGAVVITDPDTYSFKQYLDDLKAFAVAIGALAIGRGINAGLEKGATATLVSGAGEPHDLSVTPDRPTDALDDDNRGVGHVGEGDEFPEIR